MRVWRSRGAVGGGSCKIKKNARTEVPEEVCVCENVHTVRVRACRVCVRLSALAAVWRWTPNGTLGSMGSDVTEPICQVALLRLSLQWVEER